MLVRSSDLVWRVSAGVVLDSKGDEVRRGLATLLQAADEEIQAEVT